MSAFNDTVASLIPQWPAMEAKARADVVSRCCALVRRQIRRAPVHVRLGIQVLFAAYLAFRTFSRNSEGLESFSELPLPLAFGLERVLRSSVLLFYFEQPEVLTALGEETIASRQARFRAKRAEQETAIPIKEARESEVRTAACVKQPVTRVR